MDHAHRLDRPAGLRVLLAPVAECVEHADFASRGTELRAGAVIGSGTVGSGCIIELSCVHGTEAPWLRPGDRVRVDVERLGGLESTVHPSQPLHPL